MKKNFSKILLCMMLVVGLVYTPVTIPQLANTQLVAEAEAVTKVKLNTTKKVLYLKGTTTLKVKGSDKKVKWSSSRKSIATVSSKGKVTAKKPGTAVITAKVGKKKLTCKITVKKRISADKNVVTIQKVGKTAKVKITNIGKGTVVNKSMNRAIVTSKWSRKWADRGKNTLIITAKKPGTTYIRLINSFSKEVYKIKVIVPKPAPVVPDETPLVPDPEPEPEPVDPGPSLEQIAYHEQMSQLKPENVAKAKSYVEQLYGKNADVDPSVGDYTWQLEPEEPSWIYYTGLVHEGMLKLDPNKYGNHVKAFYSRHILDNGTIYKYAQGTLDAALPGVNYLSLLDSDRLTAEERTKYEKAVNYIYGQLEKQVTFPQAGNLMMHAQDKDGKPRPGWDRWVICLDGIYMSQLFLLRAAELIDDGIIVVKNNAGEVVNSTQIWNDIYQRLTFVMEHMVDEETGVPYHGYCVDEGKTNGVFWTRGIGWYSMILAEAAEKMPDSTKKAALQNYFVKLMDGVIGLQDPQSLLWYNVPNCREEVSINPGVNIVNKPETSGSAMFTYALLRGYHSGVLQDVRYYKAGLKAFNALVETKLTEDGLTDNIHRSAVHTSPNMYQISNYMTDDGKGVGPFIMAIKYAY